MGERSAADENATTMSIRMSRIPFSSRAAENEALGGTKQYPNGIILRHHFLLIDYDTPFRRECSKARAQTVIAAIALPIDEVGNFARVQTADHHLHRADVRGLHGERA